MFWGRHLSSSLVGIMNAKRLTYHPFCLSVSWDGICVLLCVCTFPKREVRIDEAAFVSIRYSKLINNKWLCELYVIHTYLVGFFNGPKSYGPFLWRASQIQSLIALSGRRRCVSPALTFLSSHTMRILFRARSLFSAASRTSVSRYANPNLFVLLAILSYQIT